MTSTDAVRKYREAEKQAEALITNKLQPQLTIPRYDLMVMSNTCKAYLDIRKAMGLHPNVILEETLARVTDLLYPPANKALSPQKSTELTEPP